VSPGGIDVEVRRLVNRQQVLIREDDRDGRWLPSAFPRSLFMLRRWKPHHDPLASAKPETGANSAHGRPLRILVRLDLDSGLVDRLPNSAAGTPIQAPTEKRVETLAVVRRTDFESPLVERETHITLAAWLLPGITSHLFSYASLTFSRAFYWDAGNV
jgi:hypothetical protein